MRVVHLNRGAEAPAFRRGEEAPRIFVLDLFLVFDVLLDGGEGCSTRCCDEVRVRPKGRDSLKESWLYDIMVV